MQFSELTDMMGPVGGRKRRSKKNPPNPVAMGGKRRKSHKKSKKHRKKTRKHRKRH